MPAGDQLAYLPPEVQQQLLGMAVYGPNAGSMGEMLASMLTEAAPATGSHMAGAPGGASPAVAPGMGQRQQAQAAAPQYALSQRDIDQIMRMDYDTLMSTRRQLNEMGYLTPDVDVHFSRRLQGLNSRAR